MLVIINLLLLDEYLLFMQSTSIRKMLNQTSKLGGLKLEYCLGKVKTADVGNIC